MIDPIIFTIEIGNFSFSLYWYGVLVMFGVAVAALLTAREFVRRGEDPEYVWDSLLWLVPAGVIGARLWYVANTTFGGDMRYIQDPVTILNIKEGGLHFYGALLFGVLTFLVYARKKKLDVWLMLDSVAPGLLLGQALARPANFINQELYGPPTTLPWGIKIAAQNRIYPYNNLNIYPEDVTRFHPTFAYEMLWNFLAAGLLLWVERKYKDKLKPGVLFGFWAILAGIGRNIVEFFRPDQPTFPGTSFSYSRFFAILMALAGLILVLIKYEVIKIKFIPAGRSEYVIAPPFEEAIEARKAEKNAAKEEAEEAEAVPEDDSPPDLDE